MFFLIYPYPSSAGQFSVYLYFLNFWNVHVSSNYCKYKKCLKGEDFLIEKMTI